MASKKYLRIQPDGDAWVDNPKDATADYRERSEVTLARLKITSGQLKLTLVEMPDANLMTPKYVICKEE
jgi:hypothetical protein